MLRRYALFGWVASSPTGGWGDHQGSHDTVVAAKAAGEEFLHAKPERARTYQVIDLTNGQVVAERTEGKS